MRRLWPFLVFILAGIAVGGGLFMVLGGGGGPGLPDLPKDVDVDVSLSGVELSQGREGRMDWRLKAKGAQYFQDSGMVRLDSPRVTYYRERGGNATEDSPPVVVTASEGEVDQKAGTMTMWPDVVIVQGDGTIASKKLFYSGADKRTIRLTGGIVLTRGGMRLDADELLYDLKTESIRADGGVSALLNAPADKSSKE